MRAQNDNKFFYYTNNDETYIVTNSVKKAVAVLFISRFHIRYQ